MSICLLFHHFDPDSNDLTYYSKKASPDMFAPAAQTWLESMVVYNIKKVTLKPGSPPSSVRYTREGMLLNLLILRLFFQSVQPYMSDFNLKQCLLISMGYNSMQIYHWIS